MADAVSPSESAEVLRQDELFGRMLIEQKMLAASAVEECLRLQQDLARQGIRPVPRLGELLMNKGQWPPAAAARGKTSETKLRRMPPDARKAAADPSRRAGKYVRTEMAGTGAMGEVWKAWDTELQRWVALKFVKVEDVRVLERLRREAQTAARLAHPNIAPVYEIGDDAGRPFIAMQFIEGKTLHALEGADRRRMVGIIRDAALALGFAHGQGVIHRDIKPGNIMVDGSGRTFVMDFGLARLVSTDATTTGKAMGTPAYMPPEQAEGRKIDQPERSDIYSLGATLYFLLARRPPFDGGSALKTIQSVIRDPVVPPSRYNREIHPDLERVVMRAMARDPARRFASCQEMADELERSVHAPSLPDDERLLVQASGALHEAHLEEAIQAFKDLHRLSSRMKASQRKPYLKEMEDEEEGLTLALKHKKDNFELRTQRGLRRLSRAIALQVQGQDPAPQAKGALEDLEAAVALQPHKPYAHLNRTCALLFLSRYLPDRGKEGPGYLEAAIKSLDAALVSDPDNAAARHNRGVARLAAALGSKREGKDAEPLLRQAVEDLAHASELDPEYAYTFKDLGAAKMALARAVQPKGQPVKPIYQEAAQHLEVACRLDERLAGAWQKLGQARFALHEFARAIEALEKTAELDPSREKDVVGMIEEAHRRQGEHAPTP